MEKKVGAEQIKDGKIRFRVWSPFAEAVQVLLKDQNQLLDLQKDEVGYWETETDKAAPGSLYRIRLDEEDTFPDPASRSQPEGVHSWSQIPISEFNWTDDSWKGRELSEMLIYELHVGTFTSKGSFEAIIEKLDHLEELGINTIELMPIAQFPGSRNWGYDGVYPYAVQDSYGGINGLKTLIDTCHKRGFAVLLDVVYNHLGPEGNYLSQFGPYFTDKYHTPWGSAVNFDDEYSDHVRSFFIQSALMWLEEFHFDGLRLDAVHEIIDRGAKHFLKELSLEVDSLEQKTGKRYILIAESDLNDNRLVTSYKKGGYGLEGQWVDDFHHAVHTVLTGENAGYYKDFGKMEFLAKSFEQGFIYDGIYSVFRKKKVGNSPKGIPSEKFVTCIQNHDQVGNRLLGERLAELVSFEELKLAAGLLLFSPYVPMLFMGEEFGETSRFQYFVSHGDPELVKAVQKGRKREFEYFFHTKGSFPDPQSSETFESSKLNWEFEKEDPKKHIFEFYKEMIRLRKEGNFKAFLEGERKVDFSEENNWLQVTSEDNNGKLKALYNFGKSTIPLKESENDKIELIISSSNKNWGGQEEVNSRSSSVPASSFVIYKIY
ncbi:malto-oligosyltrehalose trehalohydrolase [Salinimicrobium gaetbulicola]|uniref:Malto-oligosyltrehalose trehalohydrolase n=1 Tax=Salinimicrobium gaetbulicola TaxID=999702 RepID=A0ABW3ID26_9FLAO